MARAFLTGLCACVLLYGCGGGGGSSSSAPVTANPPPPPPPPVADPTRSFLMGFTPWPFNSTLIAVNRTYDTIQENGDLVAHHLKQGIPWQEALDGTPYPGHLTREIDGRVQQTLNDKVVYLAIDPLSTLRDALVGNWGENGQEPLSFPWNTRSFSHPDVITSFTNFSLDMIERFDPAYFNYGTEATELLIVDPNLFDDFAVFAREVYRNIKSVHPDLPMMISVAMKSPDSAATSGFVDRFPLIADYVDMVGISIYPYAFFDPEDGASPASLPDDWLNQIRAIAPGKPVAITETGWVGEDLRIPAFNLNVSSDQAAQREYVEMMLEGAETLNAEFVVWFTAIDFDALWRGALARDNLSLIWRDAGLYDENLNGRSALEVWQERLSLPRASANN